MRGGDDASFSLKIVAALHPSTYPRSNHVLYIFFSDASKVIAFTVIPTEDPPSEPGSGGGDRWESKKTVWTSHLINLFPSDTQRSIFRCTMSCRALSRPEKPAPPLL